MPLKEAHVRTRSRRSAAAVLAALAVSACGSTVAPVSGEAEPVGAGGVGDQSLNVDVSAEAGLDPGTAVPSASGATTGGPPSGGFSGGSGTTTSGGGSTGGSGGFSGGGGSTGGSSGGSGATSSGTTAARPGPGVTATKIFVGAPWNSDAGAANAGIGANSDAGDERQYWAAVVDDLNKRGGILGRKLEVIFAEYRAGSNEPIEAQQQAACDKWTQDNKVFAVYGAGSEILRECTRKAGVFGFGIGSANGPVLQQNPHLFDPSGIRFERLAQISVDGLAKLDYFRPEPPRWPTGKLGLISWDHKDYKYAYDHGYVPALKRQGVKLTDTAWVKTPANVNELGDASAAISSAVLRFQDQGIDHVLIQDGPAGVFRGGGLTLLFLRNAQAQRYYPRYGFNANNFPGNPNLPADQQSGMLAIDYGDTEPAQDEGIPLNRYRERCFALMKARGLSVADEQKRATAAGFCEFTWFLETVVKRTSVPTLAGAVRSAEGLGTSFGSPTTYGTLLGPGRHDGVDLVRALRFEDTCACVKYITKPYRP